MGERRESFTTSDTDAVTVVIPTKDRPVLLRRTLGSVLAQQDVELQVVVVDDGSQAGATDFIHYLGDPRVRVLRNERSTGVARARNRGLDDVGTGWVAFLDDDDMWAPDKLAAQLGAARDLPGAQWVCGGAVTVDESLHVLAAMRPPPAGPVPTLLSYNRIPGGASGTIVRTDLAREAGGFDTELSNLADWEFWILLALRSPVACVDRPMTAYLRHAQTLSGDPTGVLDEFRVIQQRFEAVRAPHGVPASSKSYEWFARRQVRAGRRSSAARSYVTIAREFQDRDRAWGLALAAAATPRALVRRWDRKGLGPVPAGWEDEVEAWLAPMRTPSVPV